MSSERILTTHVGSLPRSPAAAELLIRREAGETIDPAQMRRGLDEAVQDAIARQIDAGIDIGNDGEQQRAGFQTYLPQRMSGFGGIAKRPLARDFQETPELVEAFVRRFPRRSRIARAPRAIGEVRYRDTAQVAEEIARLKTAVAASAAPFADTFMTAPSPGIVATTMVNAYYDSHEAYVMALAREMRTEYLAIHNAGLILQIDAPDLAMERTMAFQRLNDVQFVRIGELHVQAINAATEGIASERWRLHCCWGNWEGPHTHDIALERILSVLYQARAGALSLEFANPRHQHEYAALRHNPLPPHMTLIPGVIDSTTNFVEHPQVVANRIAEAVAAVGERERVIAATDCGFATFTGQDWVVPSVVWMKLKSLRAGADIASARLWGRHAPP